MPAPQAVTATRIGPSEYSVHTGRVERGMRFNAHGKEFEVIGEPIAVAWSAVEARVREVGGRYDGNEFSAYLHTAGRADSSG